MAIRDTNKKPYLGDDNDNISVGIDLPFRLSEDGVGWFATTKTTMEAVKNNIRNYMVTKRGERLMQPMFGLGLDKYLFDQFNDDTRAAMQEEILQSINFWFPYVTVQGLEVNMVNDSFDVTNKVAITLTFYINKDPGVMESVSVEFGE